MSSVLGQVGLAETAPYCASKAGVERMAMQGGSTPEAMKSAIAALHPLGRMGEADEVAAAILYLASDESAFVTGSELTIDGGYTAR